MRKPETSCTSTVNGIATPTGSDCDAYASASVSTFAICGTPTDADV